MNEINSLGQGTKILSITDKNKDAHVNFLSKEENEKLSFKLVYYMWLSRLFIFFSTISLLVFLSSSLSLFRLAPLVEVEPFLIIRQDNSDNLVRSEPISNNMASKDLLLETFIKQYVILRNTVISDEAEMSSRWLPGGMINFLSSWPVFYQFRDSTSKMMEKKEYYTFVREVEIISIGRQGGKKSEVWKVDFKTYDLRQSNSNTGGALIMKERYWTASVTARFYPERVFMGRRLINPIGFTVVRYSQSEVEIF